MIRRILFLCTISISPLQAQEVSSSSESRHGFFTFGFDYSFIESRILNTDGTFTGLDGSSTGFHVDLGIWQTSGAEVRVFVGYRTGELQGLLQKTDQVDMTELSYGMKVITNRNFFVQAGSGQLDQNFKTSDFDVKTKNTFLLVGAGLEFSLFSSLGVVLSWDYRNNVIRKTDTMTSHSFSEQWSGTLSLIWTPPVTIITNVVK